MNEFMSLAVVAFKYLAALVITLMAFKAAYERSKGGDLKSLIVGFLTFVGVFWAFIVLFPVLFNIGFSRVYTQVEHSPHVDNLTKLAGAGVQLVMANPQTVDLNVPAVADVATELSAAVGLPGASSGTASNPLYGEPPAVKVAPAAPVIEWKGPLAPEAYEAPAAPVIEWKGPLAPEAYEAPAAPVIEWKGPLAPSYYDGTQPTPEWRGPLAPEAYDPAPAAQPTVEWKGPLAPEAYNDDGGPSTYTVQRGDSLAKIAKRFGVDVYALCNANNIRNCNVIRGGQVLVIP